MGGGLRANPGCAWNTQISVRQQRRQGGSWDGSSEVRFGLGYHFGSYYPEDGVSIRGNGQDHSEGEENQSLTT